MGRGDRNCSRLRSHDHLCLAYDDPGEFQSRVLEFLADAAYCDTAALWADLRDLDETNRAHRPDAVQVQSFDDATGAVVEPVGLVQAYAAATENALAVGFTGLRVAARRPRSCAPRNSSTRSPALNISSTGT